MDRPRQKASSTARQHRSSRREIAGFLGISLLFVLPGCAQLDQLMGKQADTGASSPPAQTAEPAPAAPAHENRPVQATEPVSKPAATKKADVSRPSGAAAEPAPQAAPATGAARQPEPEIKKTEPDKALAETNQPQKEKKSRVAADKKSKKSPKSQAESKPPAEDVFLSPIPLPSKPAAIGGSGG